MSADSQFRRAFVFESLSAICLILFGLKNVVSGETGLHSIVAIYLLVAGALLAAIAVRRRSGPPGDLPPEANGLKKAIEKLAGSKPYGFICLLVTPLPLGFGGSGLLLFFMLYLVSVNAMRPNDTELKNWVYGSASPVARKTD